MLHCIECAHEAIHRLTTDEISSTANISPMDVSYGVRYSNANQPWKEVGTRLSARQRYILRSRDCWESTKLLSGLTIPWFNVRDSYTYGP